MEDILETLFPNLKEEGIDYDDLNEDERKSYIELQKIHEAGQISLEGFKQYVQQMRESVELELVKLPEKDPRHPGMKARLWCYLTFESYFDRPERSKIMLDQYKRRV